MTTENISDEERLDAIIAAIGSMAGLDFSKKAIVNNSHDALDIMGIGLNMLAEELEENTVSRKILEQKNAELQQFAYIISHDLKTPLRGINSIAEWIEEDHAQELSDQVKNYLGLMRDRIRVMDRMIEDIFEYSCAGRDGIPYEKVNLNYMVASVLESIEIPVQHDIKILTTLPTLAIRKTPMFQVFSNLLVNSIKYNDKKKGLTTIDYKLVGSFHEFTIKDNGQGVPAAYHEKIFEIFQTLGEQKKGDSTGIGLAIVKKIIDQEGGMVKVKSQVGKGFTFRFTLPEK